MNTTVRRETLVIIGNGMVGHHCVARLAEQGALERFQVRVFGEERQRAYDRVHLSEYFGGRDAESLALCEADFYARHGVKLIGAAYESHEELGEVSLMITKHCVRWSLSLCPKQAKGVTGVQGTVRAEPLVLQHGDDKLTLKFDCKPCEMHVVGAMRKNVLKELKAQPMTFYRTRPSPARA